jgi:hypothetical protein
LPHAKNTSTNPDGLNQQKFHPQSIGLGAWLTKVDCIDLFVPIRVNSWSLSFFAFLRVSAPLWFHPRIASIFSPCPTPRP